MKLRIQIAQIVDLWEDKEIHDLLDEIQRGIERVVSRRQVIPRRRMVEIIGDTMDIGDKTHYARLQQLLELVIGTEDDVLFFF